MSLRVLEPVFVERIWGTRELAPWFPHQDRRIGEVWFQAGAGFPLLIKFLFTSEALSVQVHPDDKYAQEVENSRGKTEMWYILAAKPGAIIALGFREQLSSDQVRAAAKDGSIKDALNWVPVKAGDTYFAEAGTVHAIGAGITLCEIQQNSDVTYRLYDYERVDRELHLDKGLAVANTGPYEGRREFPVACPHFHTDLLDLTNPADLSAQCDGALIVVEGSGDVDGTAMRAGQVCLLPAGSQARVAPQGHMKVLHANCGPNS